MKNLKVTLAAMMIALFSVLGSNVAMAQKSTTADQLAANLITLQSALIAADIDVTNVTIQDVITIGDITVTDLVNVNDVLNNAQIDILRGLIVNIDIDNVLNNLLRDADILNKNQVVVGILSGGQLVVMNTRTKK